MSQLVCYGKVLLEFLSRGYRMLLGSPIHTRLVKKIPCKTGIAGIPYYKDFCLEVVHLKAKFILSFESLSSSVFFHPHTYPVSSTVLANLVRHDCRKPVCLWGSSQVLLCHLPAGSTFSRCPVRASPLLPMTCWSS